MVLDELHGTAREIIGHVLILPLRAFAAGGVADAADAVDDGEVVAVAGLHGEQLGIGAARWLMANIVGGETHAQRVFRFQPHDASVLDIDARDAVAGGGHEKAVVEAEFVRAGLHDFIPIRLARARAEAEMPFAHDAGDVARALE